MSGPKKWVSSKVHRKTSSKSSVSSYNNSPSPADDRPPPSPPIRLPKDDATAATIVDFGSGSTLPSLRSDAGPASVADPSPICSNSSLNSSGTALTQSPSTTPPKKTWEKNYRSFLKRSGKHAKSTSSSASQAVPIKTSLHKAPDHQSHHVNKPSRSLSENATSVLQRAHNGFFPSHQGSNGHHDSAGDDLGPSLADGFEDHSSHQVEPNLSQFRGSSSYLSKGSSSSLRRLAAPVEPPASAPPSPSKQRETSTRGGAFFKRLRSKTKSVDGLDESMRAGISRRSPSNTPPGSAQSSPMHRSFKSVESLDESMRGGVRRSRSPGNTPPGSASASPVNRKSPLVSPGAAALQQGVEKAAMLSELLLQPPLSSSKSLGSHPHCKPPPLAPANNNHNHYGHHRRSASQVGVAGGDEGSLDRARHRGHSVSIAASSQEASPTATPLTMNAPSMFTRVQSMGSNLVIPEGEVANVQSQEEELIRERRKAFTDFHNMGVDSSSAYLGDESSLHRNSVFLSKMAYPAGSAGGKVPSQRFSISGPRSLDQKGAADISPSTSVGSLAETKPQHFIQPEGEFSPERALRSLKGPEHWTKGERHAILPAVLCMCPIQVLNSVMSKEDEVHAAPSGGNMPPPSLAMRGSSQRGFGIGSIISEDEGVSESNGWFFADHNQHHQQPTALGGGAFPRHAAAGGGGGAPFGKILLGKATAAPLGMRSFLNEVYGWTTGVFVLRQNYLFEYREGDSLNGLPWGYAHLPFAEAYSHKHFTNALHLDFFEKPCCKSGKRSLLLRVESKGERDRWVSLLRAAAHMTLHSLYEVDESEGAPEFGHGRYAVVRPARRRDQRRAMSFSDGRYHHSSASHDSFTNASPSYDSLNGLNKSNPDLENAAAGGEYDCALKIIDKSEFWARVKKGRERADTLVREAAVQTTLAVQGADTPGFLRLRNIFETGEKLVLELELLKGTDLFQHVSCHGVLDEVEAAHIMRDLLNCLNVLDQIGIAHRDIKPANLLMCNSDDNGGPMIKLADYGMACFVGVDNLVRGRCGTPGFVAPEILLTGVNGGYGNKVDMFSAGVTLYVMLAGYEPFYGESDAELIDANRDAKVDFPHADWHQVSVEGRDLIERMLVVDPAKRIGPSEALRHPWITRRAASRQSNGDSS